jgi:serine/threonine-protein kinase
MGGDLMAREWDVPGYAEIKTLGSGGFGEVVLARHTVSGTLVAIKYLRRELLADPESAAMFRAEAAVLASVQDPNVVRLYEYVESPSGTAIVMELVEGVALREILTRQGKTSAEAALVVLQGSLLGLAAVHRRGVVHRDYKPENVLVNAQGASKLTDFGIAARAGDLAMAAGTLAYAPPEQFGGGPATPSGDVYAATATFYECLTGRPPFSGDTAERLMHQHLAEPVPLEPVPEPLRPLIEAGMAKDPGRRPADATAFVTELRTMAAGAYGPDWEHRGRSHLGEAAVLLAALWPSAAPPAAQGAAVHRVRLRRHLAHGHAGATKAAVTVGVVIAGGAIASAAVLAGHATRPPAPAATPSPTLTPTPARATTLAPAQSAAASSSPGLTWSSPEVTGASTLLGPVSCVSAAFCMTAGEAGAFTWDGQKWSSAGGTGSTLSCASPTFCMSSSYPGYATWNGATWTTYPAVTFPNDVSASIQQLSCVSSTFCAAVFAGTGPYEDFYTYGLTWNGTTWSAPISFESTAYLDFTGLTCVSPAFCLTTDIDGDVYEWNGTTWRFTGGDGIRDQSISCASATFCAAVGSGNAVTWNGSSWSAPVAADTLGDSPDGYLTAVSCPATSFCVAGGGEDSVITWNGSSWTPPEFLDGESDGSNLTSVSCPTTAFCAAVDNGGNAYTATGQPSLKNK